MSAKDPTAPFKPMMITFSPLPIFSLLALGLLSLNLPTWAAEMADEIRSSMMDQQSVALTIYNSNLALVKDTRVVRLKQGVNTLALRDVSAQIRPETALLKSMTSSTSLTLLEQYFDFDLLTPDKLLEKYVGKTVGLVKTHPTTGQETLEKAVVLSAQQGVVLQVGDRIETVIPGRIVYDEVPKNLRDRPTLVTTLHNKGPHQHTLELSYLTAGLNWKADYVAELNAKEDSIDLSGWVTLNNTSGASYRNAQLQLVAGDVNRVQDNIRPMLKTMRSDTMMDAAAPLTEQSLSEYHLYTLERPTTIADNQTKQVALLTARAIPVRKELVLKGADYYYQGQYGEIGSKLKVGVFMEFENKESAHLGMPLAKGVVRVYQKDKAANSQFVGEDNIDHTPKNTTLRLKLGEAFDVTADKKQIDFKTLPRPTKGSNAYESAYEITLNNAKKEQVTVIVQEPINGDWKILSENHVHTKANSQLVTWKIDVPAEGQTILNYRVQVKYPS